MSLGREELTPGCPHGCYVDSNWVEYTKNDYLYVKPCPIHRADWEHPETRAAKKRDRDKRLEEAKAEARLRVVEGRVQSNTERADW